MNTKLSYKKLSKRWRDLTIALALPIMILNSVMDYYYGWEARQQVIQEDYKLKWFILSHSHTEHIPAETIIDVDGNPIFFEDCLLYTSPSPRDRQKSRMPSSA